MTDYQIWTLVMKGIGIALTIGGLGFAGYQLLNAAKAYENSNLMTVVTLEAQLAGARYRVAEVMDRIASIDKNNTEDIKLAKLFYDEAVEQYLNVADRICSCFVRGFVKEEIFRKDFRPWVEETTVKFQDKLGPGTRHANIVKVKEAWADDKSAREK